MDIEIWQILLNLPLILFILLLVFIPIGISKRLEKFKKSRLVKTAIILIGSILLSAVLTCIFTYYSEEFSKNLLLRKFGFNFDGMNEVEYFQNVKPKNLLKVKEIRQSQMGIGWPIKAVFAMITFAIPIITITTFIISSKKN